MLGFVNYVSEFHLVTLLLSEPGFGLRVILHNTAFVIARVKPFKFHDWVPPDPVLTPCPCTTQNARGKESKPTELIQSPWLQIAFVMHRSPCHEPCATVNIGSNDASLVDIG